VARPEPEPPARDAVARYVEQWAAARPDLDGTPLLVIGRVDRLDALLDDLLRPPFAAAGLAPGDFDVLAALRRSGPDHTLGSTALAGQMLVTNGAATKRVDRLERQGLVSRTVSATDGRGRDVRLTARGVEVVDRLMERHLATERALLDELPAEDRDRLAELLGRLLLVVERRHADGPGAPRPRRRDAPDPPVGGVT
jgi:DNA-binding MarR family transcriptional regulator